MTAEKLGRLGYFKPVTPNLVRQTPNRPIYLGIHLKRFNGFDYIREARLPLNLVEVKPEFFGGSDRLFYKRGERFFAHQENFARLIREAAKLGLAIQFHFPDSLEGISLNPGIIDQHDHIISLFEAMSGAIAAYALMPNVTFHLPSLRWGKEVFLPEEEGSIQLALENTNRLLLKVAAEQASCGWPIELGIENQARPTKTTHALGYSMHHFEVVMAGTPLWVNLTIDAGHRILSDLSLERDILPFAFRKDRRVINLHFHENQGEQTDTYHGDQHALPLGKTIGGYLNYLRRAVQERIPVVLEVQTRNYRPAQVLLVSMGIRALMDKMEEERLLLGLAEQPV